MNTRVVILLILAIIILFAGFMIFGVDRNDELDPVDDNDIVEPNMTEAVLNRLPMQLAIGGRTVILDTTSVERSPRNEYSQENPVIEMAVGEDPIDYMERYLESQIFQEHVQDQPEFFDFVVSFHLLEEREGLTGFARVTNIPDDSVGGGEGRFEFAIENGNWMLDWYGERVFCRRMDQEFWQPADQLCP